MMHMTFFFISDVSNIYLYLKKKKIKMELYFILDFIYRILIYKSIPYIENSYLTPPLN